MTLDVRSDSPNFPTAVPLDFWNGFEEKLSKEVKFICWGEFKLSDIDAQLTQALMGTRKGVVQSDEALTEGGFATLLGLVQTNDILENGRVVQSKIIEFYNNGIRFPPTMFFP